MKLKKLDIMKTRPGISNEEIHSMMDFDKLLKDHRSAKRKGNVKWIGGVAVLLLGLTVGFYFLRPEEKPVVKKELNEPEVVVPKKDSVQEEIVEKPAPKPVVKELPKKIEAPSSTYSEAEPVNGYPDLYSYFQKELKYPVEAIKDSIEGIVSVSFVLNKEGKPGQIKILNSLGVLFDIEAIRVIEGMPAWKPATMNGKPVPAKISMPLTFQLKRKSS